MPLATWLRFPTVALSLLICISSRSTWLSSAICFAYPSWKHMLFLLSPAIRILLINMMHAGADQSSSFVDMARLIDLLYGKWHKVSVPTVHKAKGPQVTRSSADAKTSRRPSSGLVTSSKNFRVWHVDVELCNYLGTRYVKSRCIVICGTASKRRQQHFVGGQRESDRHACKHQFQKLGRGIGAEDNNVYTAFDII